MKKYQAEKRVWASNRDIKLSPKKCKAWCDRCDSYLVEAGRKCKVCGYKDYRRSLRK